MSGPNKDPAAGLAEGMMELAEQLKPIHEFIAGQVQYFLSQGFTPQEALALTAAEFVTLFGTNITRTLPDDWSPRA